LPKKQTGLYEGYEKQEQSKNGGFLGFFFEAFKRVTYAGSNRDLAFSMFALLASFGVGLCGWNTLYDKRLFFGPSLITLSPFLGLRVLVGF
jgi:hypothetical protein